MTVAAATTASARAGAAGGTRGDINALAGRLAKSEKDPDKLTEAMTGLGFPKSEARAAADKATGGNSTSKAKPARSPQGMPQSFPLVGDEEEPATKQGKPVGFSDTKAAPAYRMPSAGGSGTGVLIALVLYPAGLAFLRGGPAGLKKWFLAKFFNKVGTTGAAA